MAKLNDLLGELNPFELLKLPSYVKVIFKDSTFEKEKFKKDLMKIINEKLDDYISNMLLYYPEDEYEYEAMPNCSYGVSNITENTLYIELSPFEMLVYGHDIPDIFDLGSEIIDAVKEFLNDKNVEYEIVIISSQDFGVEVNTWYNNYSNVKLNPYADYISKIKQKDFEKC